MSPERAVRDRFFGLPEPHHKVLSYFFEEEMRRSKEYTKKARTPPQNEDLIELVLKILEHIHEGGSLPEISQEQMENFASRFEKSRIKRAIIF